MLTSSIGWILIVSGAATAAGGLVVCALTVYSAYFPATRAPILTAAVIEKFAIVVLIFFGPAKRTVAMTAVAVMDGTLAILFVAYLPGL